MKKNYLTKVERLQFSLSQEEKETLTGLFLGDLSAQKRSQTENITLRFRQGTVHEAYLLHLYELFKAFCSASPKVENSKPDKRTGKVYSAIFLILTLYLVLLSYITYSMLMVKNLFLQTSEIY